MRSSSAIDETGARYGRLVVVGRGERYRESFKWLCMCDCGNTHQVMGSNLRMGYSRSCGRCGAFVLKGDEAACRQAHHNYRRHAASRGHGFELSVDEFRAVTSRNCHYCGSPPANKFRRSTRVRSADDYIYNGIDRVDNGLGYVSGNIVPCCHVCNRAKSDMPQLDFLAWIDRVISHYKDA
jgi:hypothetical protein